MDQFSHCDSSDSKGRARWVPRLYDRCHSFEVVCTRTSRIPKGQYLYINTQSSLGAITWPLLFRRVSRPWETHFPNTLGIDIRYYESRPLFYTSVGKPVSRYLQGFSSNFLSTSATTPFEGYIDMYCFTCLLQAYLLKLCAAAYVLEKSYTSENWFNEFSFFTVRRLISWHGCQSTGLIPRLSPPTLLLDMWTMSIRQQQPEMATSVPKMAWFTWVSTAPPLSMEPDEIVYVSWVMQPTIMVCSLLMSRTCQEESVALGRFYFIYLFPPQSERLLISSRL